MPKQWPTPCWNPERLDPGRRDAKRPGAALSAAPRRAMAWARASIGPLAGACVSAGAGALTGCTAAAADATPALGLWWFACGALMGLAVAGYALGRLIEQRAQSAEMYAARSQHAALLGSLSDTVWRTDATHALVAEPAPPSGLPSSTPAASASAPLWFGDPLVQQALTAQRPFSNLLIPAPADRGTAPTITLHAAGEPPGAATPCRLQGQPLLDQQGRFAGFVGTARAMPVCAPDDAVAGCRESVGPDIGVQADLEARGQAGVQAQATAANERANVARAAPAVQAAAAALAAARAESVEADNFSFTVSHDLRAPIRVVDGFTRIVKEDYGHLLDRVGNDHLDRVLNAAARMNQMIDALLTLARLSNQPLTRQPVNLSQIAHYVVDELQRGQPGREVDVTIEDGLQVVGDPTLLRLVLENLLGNAWKYSARTPKAQISLASVRHGGGRAFVVRDNGAGFDMRAAERLFGVFQRLHSASEFAGHGVGLASARRIVRRHGGDIWAEAEPARGAAFSFTLSET